jgi:hypothetical protein
VQVLADGVSVCESDDLGDAVRVDEIVEEDTTCHVTSLHVGADGAYTCELGSVRREV